MPPKLPNICCQLKVTNQLFVASWKRQKTEKRSNESQLPNSFRQDKVISMHSIYPLWIFILKACTP